MIDVENPPSTLLVFEHYRKMWAPLPEVDRARLEVHEDRLARAGLGSNR